jgi:hypothetical protein
VLFVVESAKEDVINELQNALVADPFYGVSIEAANTLGSHYKKNNYAKSNKAYSAVVSCLEKNNKEQIFSRLHPKINQALIRNIGQFEREESINLLEPLLYHQEQQNDETTSYFVRASITTAIGKSIKNGTLSLSIDNIKKNEDSIPTKGDCKNISIISKCHCHWCY